MKPCARMGGLALVVLLAGAGCGPSRATMLETEIAQAVQTNPGHIDLAALYRAPWDRVCILGPDAREDVVNGLLGFRYPEGPYLVARNDVAGLVFVRGAEVAAAVRYPRADGDFVAMRRSYCLTRAYAVFHVVRDAAGRVAILPISALPL